MGETLWTLAGGSSVAFRCKHRIPSEEALFERKTMGKLWENHGETTICSSQDYRFSMFMFFLHKMMW